MRKNAQLFGLAALVALMAAAVSPFVTQAAKEAEEGEEKITHLYGNHACPVSGDQVDPEVFVAYADEENNVFGRIYLCCSGCEKPVKKDTASVYNQLFLTDAESEEAKEPRELENEECPVSGKAVAEDATIQYNGMIVGFCCTNCPKAFVKDPEKFMAKALPDAEEFEFEDSDSSK